MCYGGVLRVLRGVFVKEDGVLFWKHETVFRRIQSSLFLKFFASSRQLNGNLLSVSVLARRLLINTGEMKLRKLFHTRLTRFEVGEMFLKWKEITPSSRTYPYLAAAGPKPAAAILKGVDPFLLYKQYVYSRFLKPLRAGSLPKTRVPVQRPASQAEGWTRSSIPDSNPGLLFQPSLSARTLRLLVEVRSLMDEGVVEK